MKKYHLFFLIVLFLCSSCHTSTVPGLENLASRVKSITLENGMKVLLLKRGEAPVFSAIVDVKVGGVEEEEGQSGLAHFFEHLAFKGTDKIGTTDTSEFMSIFMRNGGYDVNAATSKDQTVFTVSMPSSKLELWTYLESERFKNRVFREFEKEVGVVSEERRMSIDNKAEGKLFKAFLDKAFNKNPYRNMVIGSLKDIQGFTPEMAREFYQKYYIPSRTVLCLVGNFDVSEAEKMIRKYFGSIPAKPDPNDSFAGESYDPTTFPRTVTVRGPEKSRFFLGYHRPSVLNADDVVFDVISEILCGGQTSRLIKKLVIEDQKAASVDCWAGAPGVRLDTIYVLRSMPLPGVSNQEVEALMKLELKTLAIEGPSSEELQKVINTVEARFVYSLESNAEMASQMAWSQTLVGRWEYVIDYAKMVRGVTANDVKRVMAQYFVPEREVTAYYENEGGR